MAGIVAMKGLKNKIYLMGELVDDPKIEVINSRRILTMSLSTEDKLKDVEGRITITPQVFNLIFFGKSVNVAEKFLFKGSQIAIEGVMINGTVQVNEVLMIRG